MPTISSPFNASLIQLKGRTACFSQGSSKGGRALEKDLCYFHVRRGKRVLLVDSKSVTDNSKGISI